MFESHAIVNQSEDYLDTQYEHPSGNTNGLDRAGTQIHATESYQPQRGYIFVA